MTVLSKPICIIPARSGSSRIKNKNIYKIDGIPMIGHVIKILIKSKIFSKIIVSTDGAEIAKIAIKYGAHVPFVRSKKLSNSTATIKDTVVDTIKKIKSQNHPFHFVVYPTAILIEPIDLQKAFKLLLGNSRANTLLSIVENISFFRSLVVDKKNENEINWKWKKFQKKMSQDLDKAYNDSGTFFIFKTKFFLQNKKNVLANPVIPFLIDKHKGIDVNTHDDLKMLKIAYLFVKKNAKK